MQAGMMDGQGAHTETVRVRRFVGGALRDETDALDAARLALDSDAGFVWIDLADPRRETVRWLAGHYRLHPLAETEVFEPHRESAVKIFEGAAHVIALFPRRHDLPIRTGEVQLIVGAGFLISIHQSDFQDVDRVLEQWGSVPDEWRQTSSSLVYAILSQVMHPFMPLADEAEDALNALEEETLHPAAKRLPKRDTLHRLFDLTEQISDLHDLAAPLRSVLESLSQNDAWLTGGHGHAYLIDVYDDAARLAERLLMLRDAAQRLFDMVNSLITLQRTDVSNQLTVVATVFLPLSFITGYFGQNFAYMTDGVASRWDFLLWGGALQIATLAVILVTLKRLGALD
jgi:magnesium transporter